jgi:hypothetical protein
LPRAGIRFGKHVACGENGEALALSGRRPSQGCQPVRHGIIEYVAQNIRCGPSYVAWIIGKHSTGSTTHERLDSLSDKSIISEDWLREPAAQAKRIAVYTAAYIVRNASVSDGRQ